MLDNFRSVVFRHWFAVIGLFGLYAACVAGIVGVGLGVPNVFRDPAELRMAIDLDWAASRFSPISQIFLVTPLLAATIWMLAAAEIRDHDRKSGRAPRDYAARDFVLGAAFLSLLCLCALAYSATLGARSGETLSSDVATEFARAAIGLVFGGCIAGAAILIASRVVFRPQPQADAAGLLAGYGRIVVIGLPLVLILLGFRYSVRLSAALSILTLIALANLIYFVLVSSTQRIRIGLIALLGVWLAAANWQDHYRFRFADLAGTDQADRYAPENRLALPPVSASALEQVCRDSAERRDGLCPAHALDAWLQRRRAERGDPTFRPKLVIIATSGGAYKAAYWTALALDHIAERSPELLSDIRLLTGASGGMVAAAYFAQRGGAAGACSLADWLTHDSYVAQWPADARPLSCEGQGACGCAEVATRLENPNYVARDSLSPVLQQLVQHDLWTVFWPAPAHVDRGRVLERQWESLDGLTFGDAIASESAGIRPSLIFSPMVVETGQPLWISNLALGQLRAGAPNLALELFELFPDARDRLRLSTAVRMSATFPYVSPTGVLPTEPSRGVVDAGYYDNFGMVAANAFLQAPAIQNWLLANTTGVVVLQLRAFNDTQNTDEDEESNSALERALYGLVSPIAGAASARNVAMRARNDREFDLVRRLYAQRDPDFLFETIELTSDAETSLNWYITPQEVESLRRSLSKLDGAFERLDSYWRR